MTKKPILAVNDLTITRDGTSILQGVSWRVERGENWAVLGANGSGKTSLLSALTGYLTPTAGTVEVFGRWFGTTDWRELRKSIGIVSSSVRQMLPDEEDALHIVISGRHAVINFWGRPEEKEAAVAMRILEELDCTHLAERPWQVLSQGERQRILIGRALMARPKLLILDEPCAGLDPVAREDFLDRVEALAAKPRGPALVLVTHHIEEITPAFSKVLLLRDGQVLAEGDKREVLTSRLMRLTFGRPVRVTENRKRYAMKVRRASL